MNKTINLSFTSSHINRSLKKAVTCYQDYAFLAHEIGSRLMERLSWVRLDPSYILNCSAKDQFLHKHLRSRFQQTNIIHHEIIPEFFFQAQSSKAKSSDEICSTLEGLPFVNDSFDLIVCNLWLHNVNDLALCFREFFRILKPSGLLFFSLFGPDTLNELRDCFAAVSDSPHIHEFIDMHDIGDLLMQCQFLDPVMDMEHLTLTYSSPNQLFRDIKGMGVSNARLDRQRHFFGKKRWQRMLSHYEKWRTNDCLPATVEVIYGHAWVPTKKNQFRQTAEDEFVIPVDSILNKGS